VIAIATDGWKVKAGTLSTTFSVYVGLGSDIAQTRFQVGLGTSTFVVTDSGTIGIGTISPASKFHVVGDALISNRLVSSNITVGTGLSVSGISTLGVTTFTGAVSFGSSIYFGDNDVLNIGDSNDLQIYHSGSTSFILDNGTGNLALGSNGDRVSIVKGDGTETLARFNIDDSVELWFNNVKEFETTGYGATVYGVLQSEGLQSSGITTLAVNSSSDALRITQLGSGNALVVEDETNPDSTPFVVTGIGSVGIGKASPVAKLDVVGDARISNSVLASTFIGDLTGTATNATNLSDGANITTGTINDARLPDIITSNLSASTGISTVTKLRSESIGIGTDTFTSDLAIIKDASVSLELISRTGNTTIGLGSETIGNNNTARIKYTPLSQVLDFENYGSGEVNFHVHKGTGAVVGTQTGGFYFKTGSVSRTLMNLAYDGRVSINEEVPLLTDLGYRLMVNGNTKIRGRLDLDQGITAGIVTVSSLNSVSPSTFPTTQNFNTQSGISTFNQFRVTNLLNVTGVSSFAGITTFLSGVSIGSSTVGTNSPLNIYSTATLTNSTLGLSTSKIYYDYVGGITTGFSDPRNQTKLSGLIADPNKKISAFGYGDYQVRTGGLSIICQDYINIHPSIAITTAGNWEGLTVAENSDMGLRYSNGSNLPMIGINTIFARSIVDVGYAVTSMNSYFIPPRLTTTELYFVSQLWNPAVAGPSAGNWFNHLRANSSTPNGVVSGAIVFDTTASQLKVGIGSTTFVGIATFTNNHSGFSAFIPPRMSTTERNTMTNAGISSGAIIYNSTTDRLEVRLKGSWFGITTAV
jgi:hypothetical protein